MERNSVLGNLAELLHKAGQTVCLLVLVTVLTLAARNNLCAL